MSFRIGWKDIRPDFSSYKKIGHSLSKFLSKDNQFYRLSKRWRRKSTDRDRKADALKYLFGVNRSNDGVLPSTPVSATTWRYKPRSIATLIRR